MSALPYVLGVECLRGLVELDVRHNDVKVIGELAKISSLLHLRILALTGKLLQIIQIIQTSVNILLC